VTASTVDQRARMNGERFDQGVVKDNVRFTSEEFAIRREQHIDFVGDVLVYESFHDGGSCVCFGHRSWVQIGSTHHYVYAMFGSAAR